MKIAVASTNATKVNAAAAILKELGLAAEVQGMETASGVSAQPFSLAETRQGAINRAERALEVSGAEIGIGLEGGVYELEGNMYLCNWGALAAADGQVYTAAGAQIPLPDSIASRLRQGMELGPVMDEFANESGIRHHKGAVGILTAGFVNRQEMFEHVVRLLIGQYKFTSDSVASRTNEL